MRSKESGAVWAIRMVALLFLGGAFLLLVEGELKFCAVMAVLGALALYGSRRILQRQITVPPTEVET